MKYFYRTSSVFLVLLILISPFLAAAQTRTFNRNTNRASSTRATSTNPQLYTDGASTSGTARQQQIQGYRQQSSSQQQKIAALGSIANQSVSMPVLFGVTLNDISPNFGDPRSGGRSHEGEDILAVKGTPIVSPTNAVVLRTGVGETEGNYVYTANPGGETFVYMHLDRIGEGVVSGVVLSQGSLIGYVGDTGNALGGPAHLHFEIHNSSGTPVDPFPRLTSEVPLQDKISDLNRIFAVNLNSAALATFLVTNFRSTFTLAIASNLVLPTLITNALAAVPAPAAKVIATTNISGLPSGDLQNGSSGSAVVVLQDNLIKANSGPSAVKLAAAGSTGTFGAITLSALIEFQLAKGISPASGYYGPLTRAYVASHPLAGVVASTPTITPTPTATSAPTPTFSSTITRDLSLGMSGADIKYLQMLLNGNGFTIAVSGSGSPGNETDYFGPATQAAVIKFQIAHDITPSVGYVGAITRAELSSL